MKLIIDIPEEDFERCKKRFQMRIDIMGNAIAKGIPLPKGHGRLIDADYLREDFKTSKRISFAERMDISCIVDHAPTIIEADKVDCERTNCDNCINHQYCDYE